MVIKMKCKNQEKKEKIYIEDKNILFVILCAVVQTVS